MTPEEELQLLNMEYGPYGPKHGTDASRSVDLFIAMSEVKKGRRDKEYWDWYSAKSSNPFELKLSKIMRRYVLEER